MSALTQDTNMTSGGRIQNDSLNETEIYCEADQLLINNLAIQLGFCLLYLIIFCLGGFGNLLVIIVVLKNSNMKNNVTNLFILNLAISGMRPMSNIP